ncbi:hypothetical protein [Streptomyces sp. RKAG293]|uniref:hypothetical protein n=1 Tax=Streptomyces sp. RKAG293 TaxID=2893403 RepID=UPI002033CAE4|nr:hypothetical protein [Streptomyces sp. RKAG293]MCM2417665.1 hypothetical protein [Streptomyces sp. RKAG293]
MVINTVDTAVKDASIVAKWVRAAWGWGREKARGDHHAITGAGGMGRGHTGRFVVQVCVAPSRMVKPVPSTAFPARANALAREVFGELPYTVDYSGPIMARFVVKGPPEYVAHQLHQLVVHATGLVDLSWGLTMGVVDEVADPLPVTEVVGVVVRLHGVVQGAVYRNLYRKRRGENRRRLDWRIGVTGTTSTNNGQVGWTRLDIPGSDAFTKAENRWPDCPMNGFAADRLLSRKCTAPTRDVVRPMLEELLLHAGYMDAHACVEVIEPLLGLDTAPRPALA